MSFIENFSKAGLVPFLSKKDPKLELTLMENNTPVLTAIISQTFQKENGIRKLEPWPAQSHNFNPNKNVWKVLKTEIQDLCHPQNLEEMQHCLKLVWDDFLDHILCNIGESIPSRMKAVIKSNGGPTCSLTFQGYCQPNIHLRPSFFSNSADTEIQSTDSKTVFYTVFQVVSKINYPPFSH